MRGYRLTTLGKVVVFSLFLLIILSTAYTVKAFIYHRTNSNNTLNNTLNNTSNNAGPTTQKSQINILEKINIPYTNGMDSSSEVDINKLKDTKLTIYFQPDDDHIKDQYYEALDMFTNVADILKDFIIEIEGNCATVYTDIDDNKNNVISYNLSLSRAKATLNYLQEKGIAPNRIVIIGNGSDKPIKANTTEEERQYNRRVEISFKLNKK